MFKVLPSKATKDSGTNIIFQARDNFARKGVSFDSDTPHMIRTGDRLAEDGKLHVFIGGTGAVPTGQHCGSNYMQVVSISGWASIALSYEWANHADQAKNVECVNTGSNDACQQLLKEYHHAVCYGGSAAGLTNVHVSGSILGRLVTLLVWLANTRRPSEGWGTLLRKDPTSAGATGELDELVDCVDWSRIVLSGHSQGSGHVAYLGQRIPFGRIVLLSGPQEASVNDNDVMDVPHWLDDKFKASEVYALMHKDEEGTSDLIRHCWSRIDPLKQYQQSDEKIRIKCLADAVDRNIFNVSTPLVETQLTPTVYADDIDARPNHNSITSDRKTPMMCADGLTLCVHEEDIAHTSIAVYGKYTWPYVLGCL